ncbi:epsin [Entomortierella parvispora]|uniref:Epsin n=1 Tax=Entomortierella parvispora TaxID=205924 RepID=A0A9P3LZ98_9FUNG|nr:epsin [Entomortierella parvispora]
MASATPKYAAKSTIRSIKNFSKGYTDMQAKVREATSNDPWGPSGTQMNELARATFNQQEFLEIMEILDKRMNDKGKNWRHVFKALTVLDYLLHVGSESVVKYARENLYIVKTLKEFQYIDEEGKDQGSNVRQKAKDITALLSDESRLKEERRSRNAMRDRMSGRGDHEDHTPVYEGPGAGDDDRDLQRALEESRRMAQNESGRNSEEDDLQKALELSRKEEQDRMKTVEKYNELSLTEDWDVDSKPVNLYEQQQLQQNNTDFFANDFGGSGSNNNNNNANFDAFAAMNEYGNDNTAYLQQQQTGFNNPYLQFQQQQLAQQQAQQQLLMQQQLAQQQAQQQQQLAFMNMNNPYQQQMMPQMTGAPAIGSNNPFSAFAQKPAMTGMNGFNSGSGMNSMNNGTNSTNSNSNNNPLGELAFLQNAMTSSSPSTSQPAAPTKAPNANDEKYAHLAMALNNRDDGMDTFGNTGQLRIPTYHGFGLGDRGTVKSNPTGVANPFQSLAGNNSNSLIDIGGPSVSSSDNSGFLGRSNTTSNNPFQLAAAGGAASSPSSGFLSSQATGFGGMNSFNAQQQNNGGAYSGNTLF